jgi:mannosyltransferase OCH1-like enzyme
MNNLPIYITAKEYPSVYIDELKKNNPKSHFHFFNDSMCESLIKKNFHVDVYNAYNKLKATSYRADLFRYCVLYVNGGIYTDNGVKYTKSFNEIYPHGCNTLYMFTTFPRKYKNKEETGSEIGLQIALMCATIRRHPFLKILIDKCVENIQNEFYGNTPVSITGPSMAYNEYLKYKNEEYPVVIIGKFTSHKNKNQKNVCDENYRRPIVNNKNEIISCWKPNSYYEKHKKNQNAHYSKMWKNKDIYY